MKHIYEEVLRHGSWWGRKKKMWKTVQNKWNWRWRWSWRKSKVKMKLAYETHFFCLFINHHGSERPLDICLRKTTIWGIQIVSSLFQSKTKTVSCINPDQILHKFEWGQYNLQQRKLWSPTLGINEFVAQGNRWKKWLGWPGSPSPLGMCVDICWKTIMMIPESNQIKTWSILAPFSLLNMGEGA